MSVRVTSAALNARLKFVDFISDQVPILPASDRNADAAEAPTALGLLKDVFVLFYLV